MEAGIYALGLHTTQAELGLGLTNFSNDCRYQVWNLGRELSTHLHSHLAEFIWPQTWSALSFLAIANGPGSFTGTRIGVVTARTLAQQLNLPLFPISALATLAWGQRFIDASNGLESQNFSLRIAVEIPAQRGEVFAAIYEIEAGKTLTPVLADSRLTLEVWQQHLQDLRPVKQLRVDAEPQTKIACQSLLELAYQRWQEGERPLWSATLPFYG